MKVEVISYTRDCEKLIAAASKLTLSKKPFEEIWGSLSEDEIDTWIKETVTRWHFSPWEHCVYTFYISGVSRVLTHQLVRHRIASYSQHSQRFKALHDIEFVVPDRINMSEEAKRLFLDTVDNARDAYRKLIEKGIPFEDARYVLPQAVTTKILVTMNARELMHFFSLRMCTRAQLEIRRLAWLMWRKVYELHPRLWKWAGPRCMQTENLIRRNPIELPRVLEEAGVEFVSEKCPEGLPRESIVKCLRHSYHEVIK